MSPGAEQRLLALAERWLQKRHSEIYGRRVLQALMPEPPPTGGLSREEAEQMLEFWETPIFQVVDDGQTWAVNDPDDAG